MATASVGGASVGGASVGEASVGGALVGGASVGGASVGGASVGGASVGGASVGGASVGGPSGLPPLGRGGVRSPRVRPMITAASAVMMKTADPMNRTRGESLVRKVSHIKDTLTITLIIKYQQIFNII